MSQLWSAIFCATGAWGGKPIGHVRVKFLLYKLYNITIICLQTLKIWSYQIPVLMIESYLTPPGIPVAFQNWVCRKRKINLYFFVIIKLLWNHLKISGSHCTEPETRKYNKCSIQNDSYFSSSDFSAKFNNVSDILGNLPWR